MKSQTVSAWRIARERRIASMCTHSEFQRTSRSSDKGHSIGLNTSCRCFCFMCVTGNHEGEILEALNRIWREYIFHFRSPDRRSDFKSAPYHDILPPRRRLNRAGREKKGNLRLEDTQPPIDPTLPTFLVFVPLLQDRLISSKNFNSFYTLSLSFVSIE